MVSHALYCHLGWQTTESAIYNKIEFTSLSERNIYKYSTRGQTYQDQEFGYHCITFLTNNTYLLIITKIITTE